MTTLESLGIPQVDADVLEANNDLVGVTRSLTSAIGGESYAVRLSARECNRRGTAAAVLVDGRRIWVTFCDWNAMAAVRELLDGESLDRLPTTIAVALLNAAFEENLDHLSHLTSGECQVTAIEPVESLDENLRHVGLELAAADGQSIRGAILTDAAAMEMLRDVARRLAPITVRSGGELPLSAGVEIGLAQLTFDDLRSLSAGDLVLLDVTAPRDKPAGLLRFAPEAIWRVSLADGRTTLLEPVKLAHWGREPSAAWGLTLVFEQGRVELSAAEVAGLQSGAELQRVDDESIAIRSGADLLGRGEVVYLGDRAGVRIRDWFAIA